MWTKLELEKTDLYSEEARAQINSEVKKSYSERVTLSITYSLYELHFSLRTAVQQSVLEPTGIGKITL